MKSKILVKSHRTRAYKFLHIKKYGKIWCIACRELARLSREKISYTAAKKSLTPKREMLTVSEIRGDRHLLCMHSSRARLATDSAKRDIAFLAVVIRQKLRFALR